MNIQATSSKNLHRNFGKYDIIADYDTGKITVKSKVHFVWWRYIGTNPAHIDTDTDFKVLQADESYTTDRHEKLNDLLRKNFSSVIHAWVYGASSFAQKYTHSGSYERNWLPVYFELERTVPAKAHCTIYLDFSWERTPLRSYLRTNRLPKNNKTYTEMYLHDGFDQREDWRWQRAPYAYRFKEVAPYDQLPFTGPIRNGAPVVAPWNINVALHELYHLFFSSGKGSDEYYTSSPYSNDYKSLANAGAELRARHLDAISRDFNRLDSGTKFQVRLK